MNPADANGLVSIAQTQPAAVVFAVPAALEPRIREQLRAGVPLRVEAWDGERNTMLAEGRVASNDNAIDVATGTRQAEGVVPEQPTTACSRTSRSTCGCSSTRCAAR